VWDGFTWTTPGLNTAIDGAFSVMRDIGWGAFNPEGDSFGLARATYGYYMAPYNPNPSRGMVVNSSMYVVGYTTPAKPSIMGSYTKYAVSLFGGGSLFGRLNLQSAPILVARMDQQWPSLPYNLICTFHTASLTPWQVASGNFSGGVSMTISPATINSGAVAVGGSGTGWYQYYPEVVPSYYHQCAPFWSHPGWHPRIEVPAGAASMLAEGLASGSVHIYFKFVPVYPPYPTLDDMHSIFFSDLIFARLEVFSE